MKPSTRSAGGLTRRECLLAGAAGLGGLALFGVGWGEARAEEIPAEFRPCVDRGLAWLAKSQGKDGRWEETGGQYPTAMTALAGMCFLMEGSTLAAGRYRESVRRAVDWLLGHVQSNGLIAAPDQPGEAGRYMHGHGYALLFLSCVYGEEEDRETRLRLEDVLGRAARFSRQAQTHGESKRYKDRDGKPQKLGGWGYVAATDGNNFDEGPNTLTQVQALHVARRVGVAVPPEAIQEAANYLSEATTEKGGILYSLTCGNGDGRPSLTAAAVAAAFSAGDYSSPRVRSWLKFCRGGVAAAAAGGCTSEEYTHYYYGQVAYILGDDGYAKLFPESKPAERIRWSDYRKDTFAAWKAGQQDDGRWTGGTLGVVYRTVVRLFVMQLDRSAVPVYQRPDNLV
jgi:hypothetical protein